jgi:CheY-like chemotaxis protein
MRHHTQFRILALEPDAERGENLKRLVRERVDAEVTVATSAASAIAALNGRLPDLILTSALALPADDEQLLSHLKQLGDAKDLPILTVPPAVQIDEPKPTRVSFSFLKRRRAPSIPPYDPEVVGRRIAEAVARARAKNLNRLDTPPWESSSLPGYVTRGAVGPQLPHEDVRSLTLVRPSGRRRDRAPRWTPADVPWFSSVQTASGIRLDLLNISRSGLLAESPSRFMPDSLSELHLLGYGRSIIVPARLVRSEVAEVNNLGVKYRTAVVFNHRLDLILEKHYGVPRSEFAIPKALSDLLTRALEAAGGGQSAEARALFEQGLRELVPAREIQLRSVPAPGETGESVYFTVPTDEASQPILQVTFEPDYEPGEEEMSLLKAAASVAATMLKSDKHSTLVLNNAW